MRVPVRVCIWVRMEALRAIGRATKVALLLTGFLKHNMAAMEAQQARTSSDGVREAEDSASSVLRIRDLIPGIMYLHDVTFATIRIDWCLKSTLETVSLVAPN